MLTPSLVQARNDHGDRLGSIVRKGGQWEQALSLLKEMQDPGAMRYVLNYSVFISVCKKGGQWEQTLS